MSHNLHNLDPVEWLLRQEARTCKGCTHEIKVLGRSGCMKGREHGRRCTHYRERVVELKHEAR